MTDYGKFLALIKCFEQLLSLCFHKPKNKFTAVLETEVQNVGSHALIILETYILLSKHLRQKIRYKLKWEIVFLKIFL